MIEKFVKSGLRYLVYGGTKSEMASNSIGATSICVTPTDGKRIGYLLLSQDFSYSGFGITSMASVLATKAGVQSKPIAGMIHEFVELRLEH